MVESVALGLDLGSMDRRLIMSGVTLNSHSSSSGEVTSVSEPDMPSKSASVLLGEAAAEEGEDIAVATGATGNAAALGRT